MKKRGKRTAGKSLLSRNCPVETGRPRMVGASGSPECGRLQVLQGPEPVSRGPSSVMQCHPGPSPHGAEGKGATFTASSSRVQQNVRKQGGVGLTGSVCPQLEKTGHLFSLSLQSLESVVQVHGCPILDMLHGSRSSIFPLALPCLHSPRWQPEPRAPLIIWL